MHFGHGLFRALLSCRPAARIILMRNCKCGIRNDEFGIMGRVQSTLRNIYFVGVDDLGNPGKRQLANVGQALMPAVHKDMRSISLPLEGRGSPVETSAAGRSADRADR